MRKYLIAASMLLAFPALAQQPPFIPFTIDAQKYQQIDDAIAKLPMSRDAHSAWIQIWQSLERQAQQEEAAKQHPEPKK